MLKEKYYTSEGSIYICDLCGKLIKKKDTSTYKRIKDKQTNKAFDLCDKCDRKLNKKMESYAKKIIKGNKTAHCPKCNNELISSHSCVIATDYVYFKCNNCGHESKWDFNAVCPILIEEA